MGPGNCSTCHTADSKTMHHGNAHTIAGDCEHCHTDPRNVTWIETLPTGGVPKHLPCEECHVTPKAYNGWANGQMTIFAFDEGSTHSTTNYSTNFTTSTANGGGHVIPNTAGAIDSWGVCFSCHGSSAIAVRPFHAKPTTYTATNQSCGTSGTARYMPGREARNDMGNFDFFAAEFRPTSTRPGGTGSCNQAGDWTGSVKYGATDFSATDLVIPDPWGTGTFTVPVFPAQTN
jgi:hypothetical protein